jgi:hypothetical protein
MAMLVVAGQLPDGMSMDSNGEITGVPTEAGTFLFSVEGEDQNGFMAEKDLILVVYGLPQ